MAPDKTLKNPIVVDRITKTIQDRYHRFSVLKGLGYNKNEGEHVFLVGKTINILLTKLK